MKNIFSSPILKSKGSSSRAGFNSFSCPSSGFLNNLKPVSGATSRRRSLTLFNYANPIRPKKFRSNVKKTSRKFNYSKAGGKVLNVGRNIVGRAKPVATKAYYAGERIAYAGVRKLPLKVRQKLPSSHEGIRSIATEVKTEKGNINYGKREGIKDATDAL
jgi:hypothetical protein